MALISRFRGLRGCRHAVARVVCSARPYRRQLVSAAVCAALIPALAAVAAPAVASAVGGVDAGAAVIIVRAVGVARVDAVSEARTPVDRTVEICP